MNDRNLILTQEEILMVIEALDESRQARDSFDDEHEKLTKLMTYFKSKQKEEA